MRLDEAGHSAEAVVLYASGVELLLACIKQDESEEIRTRLKAQVGVCRPLRAVPSGRVHLSSWAHGCLAGCAGSELRFTCRAAEGGSRSPIAPDPGPLMPLQGSEQLCAVYVFALAPRPRGSPGKQQALRYFRSLQPEGTRI